MHTHIDTGEMESESRPWLTLDLDTDNFQSQETNSTASEHQISRSMAHSVRAIYSTRLALFIHGIMSAKKTCEVQPAVLSRESSAQLIMYSLDTCVKYSTYIPIFKSQKGSTEALSFWQLPHRLGHHYLITAEK